MTSEFLCLNMVTTSRSRIRFRLMYRPLVCFPYVLCICVLLCLPRVTCDLLRVGKLMFAS